MQKKDVCKDKDGEGVTKLESDEVVLVIYSIIVIREHLKYYLLLCLIYNLFS